MHQGSIGGQHVCRECQGSSRGVGSVRVAARGVGVSEGSVKAVGVSRMHQGRLRVQPNGVLVQVPSTPTGRDVGMSGGEGVRDVGYEGCIGGWQECRWLRGPAWGRGCQKALETSRGCRECHGGRGNQGVRVWGCQGCIGVDSGPTTLVQALPLAPLGK